MNIDAVKKTAVLSQEDGDYVVRSPLCEMVIGAGDTPEEAWQIFHELLDDHIAERKAGRIADGPGQPSKGNIKLNTALSPQAKERLAYYADELQVSIGEIIEYLLAFHESAPDAPARKKKGA